MLVCLQRKMQHLPSLVALLVDQLVADGKQPREGHLNDLVEVRPVALVRILEPIRPANRQQALQACEDGARIVGVEHLVCEVEERRPLFGKVVVQDAL
jgi:hypothetical protein